MPVDMDQSNQFLILRLCKRSTPDSILHMLSPMSMTSTFVLGCTYPQYPVVTVGEDSRDILMPRNFDIILLKTLELDKDCSIFEKLKT